jgi:predicted dehydrogenase
MADTQVGFGILGCGPIAQFTHFESVRKARNARLRAICDVADDLVERMAGIHQPEKAYTHYEDMLADPEVSTVIIAAADDFHAALAVQAVRAGKHVLVEKPFATSVEDAEALLEAAQDNRVLVQVGQNKRFDPGIQSAREFIATEMGEMIALRAWYCDSTHRYTNTDALQPIPLRSAHARSPSRDPKGDKARYFLLAHGSHLVDMARFLAGEIVAVRARLARKFGAYSWFVEVELANGANAHLDLTVAVRMDWHEGFHVYGEHGSVIARTFNPWYHRASEVDCFHERTATWTRVLGADSHTYRRQIEALAAEISDGTTSTGARAADGLASVQALRAIQLSVERGERVALSEARGAL